MSFLKRLLGKSNPGAHPLREKAFRTTAPELGLTPSEQMPVAFGMIMEQSFPGIGLATLVYFGEGSCSMYWGDRGGIIGAGQHETVRTAAERWLAVAQNTYKLGSESPCEANDLRLVWRGFTEDRYACLSVQEALSEANPLHELAAAGQAVITQIRLIDQARKRPQ